MLAQEDNAENVNWHLSDHLGSVKDLADKVPTIQFQREKKGLYQGWHNTPDYENVGRVKFEYEDKDSCPDPLPRPLFNRDDVELEARPGRREPFSLPEIRIPPIRLPEIRIPPIFRPQPRI